MFEITADDIALLNDEDLRSLVGRLCESDVKGRGVSPSCVTWGGNQNAGDGGIDVRVALPAKVEPDGFIPRTETGYQAKAEDTPAGKIEAEMRPEGVLRPVIRELADRSGAYIIVSSQGSVSGSALRNRRKAMKDALWDLPNRDALLLDFYDRRRLETWLRDHAGATLWVREKIGKPLAGWSGYGAWSYPQGGADSAYLVGDELRVRTNRQGTKTGLSAVEGIQSIRDSLRNPRGIARLVGLSGVGKTRLVQALFDDRVGEQSLDAGLAVYTNLAGDPNPIPTALARELIDNRRRVILVVDNCRPELHRRLADLCLSDRSLLSLITVEYDIQEDEPEGTDVFVLEAGSADLTEKLIRGRFVDLSAVDATRIASFSGGNARIAIALAGRIEKGEAISQLTDQELFRRLFHQRHEPDEELFSAAQGLSLVYSFDGENVSGDEKDELSVVGSLVGKSALEMFKQCAELMRRGLVQRRSLWRAVLPDAIANRLAALALENIPVSTLEDRFQRKGRERLLQSFSRRLGYLTDSKEARSICSRWLGPGGMLSDLAGLDEVSFAIFRNVAPVSPASTLESIQRAVLGEKGPLDRYRRYLRTIRSLAYDPAFFEQCTTLLVKIIESGVVSDENDEGRRIFTSLFPLYFSGTQARIEKRLAVAKSLLLSGDSTKELLGLAALRATLEASHFGGTADFEFGAHLRDFGWWPRTVADVHEWFQKGLQLAEEIALSDRPIAGRVRDVIAEQFRGLWSAAGMYDDLERVCRRISEKAFWSKGWIAVRQTMHYDSASSDPEIAKRLAAIEAFVKPTDLPQKVRSIVLPENLLYVGVDASVDGTTDVQKSMAQVEAVAEQLGRATANDAASFESLLPELVSGEFGQLWHFGRGLAEETQDPRATWKRLASQVAVTPREKQNVQVLRGFLHALNGKHAELVSGLLDDAVEDSSLGSWYPVLQTAVGVDKAGVVRLLRSLRVGKAGVGIYGNLVMGGVTHNLSANDFRDLLIGIASVQDGLDIAMELLFMRLSHSKTPGSPDEISELGCELISRLVFTKRKVGQEYRLRVIANECLRGQKGEETVRLLCGKLKEAVAKSETYPSYHGELLGILFELQPRATLEAMCGGEQKELDLGMRILDEASGYGLHPLDGIPEEVLLSWCDEAPGIRYAAVASAITPVEPIGAPGQTQWRSVARKLLDRAPDRQVVLKCFTENFTPWSWRGSRADIVQSNLRLLDGLTGYSDAPLLEFINQEKARLRQAIQSAAQTDDLILRMERESDERFE